MVDSTWASIYKEHLAYLREKHFPVGRKVLFETPEGKLVNARVDSYVQDTPDQVILVGGAWTNGKQASIAELVPVGMDEYFTAKKVQDLIKKFQSDQTPHIKALEKLRDTFMTEMLATFRHVFPVGSLVDTNTPDHSITKGTVRGYDFSKSYPYGALLIQSEDPLRKERLYSVTTCRPSPPQLTGKGTAND